MRPTTPARSNLLPLIALFVPVGKRVAETLMYAYHTQNDVEVRVARIFNTYGPRMRLDDGAEETTTSPTAWYRDRSRNVPSHVSFHLATGRLMSSIIRQAMSNEPITVHGDGSQTRSFMYVSDLVEGLVKLMASNYSQPVNLGHETPVSITSLVKKIQDITGSASRLDYCKFFPLLCWGSEMPVDQELNEMLTFWS